MRTRDTLTFSVLVALVFSGNNLLADVTNVAPIAVVVGFDKGTVQYEVGSKPVRSEMLLEVFGGIKKQRGGEIPVVVLIDQRNSLAALSNVRGIIDKAGFSEVRYFYFTVDRQRMAEIVLNSSARPFSLNPSSVQNQTLCSTTLR